jgi:uncharacterized protein
MTTTRHRLRSGATHLDPRAPFVLDTRELGRRPGAMRRVQRTVAAPADWQLDLVRVPEGSEVRLDLRLESVLDGVLVSGVVHAELAAECGRCLEPVEGSIDVEIQQLFAYDATDVTEDDDVDLGTVDGDLVDAESLIRDAVVLDLPVNPLCAPDCAGLCPGCGEPRRTLAADHTHEGVDPRWAALAALRPDQPAADPSAAPETGS